MIFVCYWRNKYSRQRCHGYIEASDSNKAYDILRSKLSSDCEISAIYEAAEHQITPQSLCINFVNHSDYMYPWRK